MKRVGRVAIPDDIFDRILELERRLDDLEGMAALPTVDPETGGDTYVSLILEADDYYLRLDCSNDPLTNPLTIEGYVNLNQAGAEYRIEGDHALSLEDRHGDRTNVRIGTATDTYDSHSSVLIGHDVLKNGGTTATYDYCDSSVLIGHECAISCDFPYVCVGIGESALAEAVGPGYTVAVGSFAGEYLDWDGDGDGDYDGAFQNVLVGDYAGRWASHISYCVAVGAEALKGASGDKVMGWYNHAFGYGSLQDITTGERNVGVGRNTGASLTTHSGCVFLGDRAGGNATASNRLYIENSNSATPLIYGEFDNDLVRVNGDLEVTGTITGQSLLTNGDTSSPELVFEGGDVIMA